MAIAISGMMGMQQTSSAAKTPAHVPPPLVLSACENPSDWSGGTLDTTHVKQGHGAIRWAHGKSASLSLHKVPEDWSAYNTLSFDLYSVKATGSRFLVYIGSENPKTEGMDYYSATIRLDFTGWRTFTFPFSSFGVARTPLGWKKITSFRFTASGWGNTPNPEAVVTVDNLRLTWVPPPTGPRLTDKAFFDALNLSLPALSAVKAAVEKGDYEAARHAFVAHIKSRTKPVWFFNWRDRPHHATRPQGVDTTAADKVVAHILTSCGISYHFGHDIDWSINPTKLKYKEWTWQLSRHPFWVTLGRAYWATGEEKYAKEFVYEMNDWVKDNPVPLDNSGNYTGSRWRTIETGIRMSGSWPNSFFYFLSSPSFDDDSIITMIKSMVEHAHHLMAYPTRNNWLTMEMNGLFHVGVLFPEFKDAATWRNTAADRLYKELDHQVYPDGAQVELTTGYHGVALQNFLGIYQLAKLNDIKLPADYEQRMEKMFGYYLKLVMPDGRMPALNDAGWGDARGRLSEGFKLFPKRTDFEYVATRGRLGTVPAFTSVDLPYAGWAVMRTGWGPRDLYLHFAYGPFGAGHQHEDKLSLIIHAYGRRLLTEAGTYPYDSSQWRRYVISSRAHNVAMVDGMEQHRRGLTETYVTTKPLPNRWIDKPQFDFAEGWYDDGFGDHNDRTVTQYRAVLFVKPRYWLVVDRFVPTNRAPHRYDVMFHFNTKDAAIIKQPLAALSTTEDAANLAIVPLCTDGVSANIVCGQVKPTVQGWVPAGGYKVRPVATPIFSKTSPGIVVLPWLLYPLRPGEALPLREVRTSQENGTLVFTMVFDDGRQDELRVPAAAPGKDTTGALHWASRRDGKLAEEIGIPER